jgi:hypothetical protein
MTVQADIRVVPYELPLATLFAATLALQTQSGGLYPRALIQAVFL